MAIRLLPGYGNIEETVSDEKLLPGYGILNETAGVTTSIKTILGLAKASVKTVDGLAIASVKTWDGLS